MKKPMVTAFQSVVVVAFVKIDCNSHSMMLDIMQLIKSSSIGNETWKSIRYTYIKYIDYNKWGEFILNTIMFWLCGNQHSVTIELIIH